MIPVRAQYVSNTLPIGKSVSYLSDFSIDNEKTKNLAKILLARENVDFPFSKFPDLTIALYSTDFGDADPSQLSLFGE